MLLYILPELNVQGLIGISCLAFGSYSIFDRTLEIGQFMCGFILIVSSHMINRIGSEMSSLDLHLSQHRRHLDPEASFTTEY